MITLTTTAVDDLGEALGDGGDLTSVPALVLDGSERSFDVVSTSGTGCRAVRFEVTCPTAVVHAATTTGTLERVGPRGS